LTRLPHGALVAPQEKRSNYAPPEAQPVRYDGIYRIAACWRRPGAQGLLMCRYLFIRCDNEAAPWSSDGTPQPSWVQHGNPGCSSAGRAPACKANS
jgi:SAD/SRA domain